MLTINNYVRPKTIEEAHDYAVKPKSVILGGMLWLKMMNREVDYAIDLSDLNLDQIEVKDDEIHIGAMVNLRDLEVNPILNEYTHGAIKEAMRHIVGVQFRNLATIGGSLFGRFGFSDVLTIFMAMDAYVELYPTGIVPIREFANMKMSKDILVRVIVKKTPLHIVYLSQRNSETDFPVLTCAVSHFNNEYYCIIGARPLKAIDFIDENHCFEEGINEDSINNFVNYVIPQLVVGSNLRGSSEYRKKIAKVLIKRAFLQLKKEEA